jgi:hypothetical protein
MIEIVVIVVNTIVFHFELCLCGCDGIVSNNNNNNNNNYVGGRRQKLSSIIITFSLYVEKKFLSFRSFLLFSLFGWFVTGKKIMQLKFFESRVSEHIYN